MYLIQSQSYIPEKWNGMEWNVQAGSWKVEMHVLACRASGAEGAADLHPQILQHGRAAAGEPEHAQGAAHHVRRAAGPMSCMLMYGGWMRLRYVILHQDIVTSVMLRVAPLLL